MDTPLIVKITQIEYLPGTKAQEDWKNQQRERIYAKYGGVHFTQTEEYNERRQQSIFKKYGVYSTSKDSVIFNRMMTSRYKRKIIFSLQVGGLRCKGMSPGL